MRSCPTCHRQYEDETLKFCLDDGARLVAGKDEQATWHLPQTPVPPTQAAPRVTVPVQPTITARPEQFQISPRHPVESAEPESRRSPLPWILAIVVAIGLFGALIAWIVTRPKADQVSIFTPTPTPTRRIDDDGNLKATPTPIESPTPREDRTPRPTPTPTPKPTPAKPQFSVLNNTSFDGSRITYYPRPSFGQCQADCAGNASCRGFTWIRPGAYNPGDSAMCYLMSAVTGRSSHPCCISATKN